MGLLLQSTLGFTSDIVLVVDLIPITTFVINRDYSVSFQTLTLSGLLRRVFLTVRILFHLIGGFVLELLWRCLLWRNYLIMELSDCSVTVSLYPRGMLFLKLNSLAGVGRLAGISCFATIYYSRSLLILSSTGNHPALIKIST